MENCLLVFVDSCEEIFNDKELSKLATAGRHKKISFIYVKHNLFQQSKWSRTIDLNTTHIILFKSPRDIQQISYIGKQLNNTNILKDSYDLATKQQFGHILIDLDPKTTNSLRYCSNIVPPGPTIFYLPSSKAVITHLTNERERDILFFSFQRDKFEEIASAIGKKFTSTSKHKSLLLPLLEEVAMHAEEFVLIPKRMFVSKQPTRTEILDNPIYKQKAAQLSLLQRNNPANFESKEATEQETNKTNIVNKRKRRRTSSVDLKSELDDGSESVQSFFSDDGEIEPSLKKKTIRL